MSLERGTVLGDYRILSRIGTGAYGEVYEAVHAITRRHDAIKLLSDGRLHTAEEEQRFVQEIQVQASLHHPNIAAVYNAFSTPYGLALVMEWIQGEPLSAILARGRIGLDRGIGLILEMLAALAYAHEQGVVHRDIKPENVIVTAEGTVKLADFGLARSAASPRLTQSGAFAGSPSYMSPEQARGTKTADARCDTYSAGVVLYEVATGQLPFNGESTIEVLLAHQYSAPPPPEQWEPAVGAPLSQVILKSLEKEPDKRYQTAGEFYADLQSAAALAAPAPQAVPTGGRTWNRVALAAGACAILAAGTVSSFIRHREKALPAAEESVRMSNAVPPAILTSTREADPPQLPAPITPIPGASPAVLLPLRTPAKAPRAVQPPPDTLRITGSVPDVPRSPAQAEVPAANLSEPARPQVTASRAPEPPAPAMAGTPVAQPQEFDATVPADASSDKASSPKRRNVVVRVFQKMFHAHPKTTEAEGVSGIRPSGTDPAKQP